MVKDRTFYCLVMERDAFSEIISLHARPLERAEDLDPLIDSIGHARLVLLGEASHGTKEYYQWRTRITRRLVEEKNFSFVAVEGDWPDCSKLNRFIQGIHKKDTHPRHVLRIFRRWPTWMWANEEIVELIDWLLRFNQNSPEERKISFYGLDVYSLWESLEALMDYLKKNDPRLWQAAHQVYACFEPFHRNAQSYAYSSAWLNRTCEQKVVTLLSDLRTQSHGYQENKEDFFNAEQNALILKNAEHYYRTMIRSDVESWNIRDTHMADTLERLMRFHGKHAKAIVWAHNTHIGDARATDMVHEGALNIGQLVRKRFEKEGVVLVGFGSYQGEVIAGKSWEAPFEIMPVPEAKAESWEDIFHRASPHNKLLIFDKKYSLDEAWFRKRGHRAIGVVYNPDRELGNYVPTILPMRYDAFLYFDKTCALHPLPVESVSEELPETYPSAL